MSKSLTLSIIIVNYKVKKELFDCIDSILNSKTNIKYEIIVVDNSDINEIESDLKKKYPQVIYKKTDKNLGYGNGNNLGVSIAKGEYIFILNPDTKIVSGKIESLINFIKQNKKVGVVSPQLVDIKNEVYDEQGARELTPKRAIAVLSFINRIFPRNRYWKEYWKIPWNKEKPKEVDVVPGTAFIIKKELFEKIGGFDSNFFLYFEEFDLCRRLRKLGFKNYILPDLKISHIWGASTKKNNSSKKYFLKSRFYYFKKNFGLPKALIVELFLRINKELIILLPILIIAFILRAYNLADKIAFIGDAAWFFVSAKNMITDGVIPYVGITSSHVWLHQGAFWTYILAPILVLTKFNPIYVSYFTIFLDLATLTLVYYFASKYFNFKTAIFASLFYATSPLLITSSQNAYHTSPIPFLTILLIYSVIRWVKGSVKFFPIVILLTTFLYNFQISILPLAFCVISILIYGTYKRTNYATHLKNKKIITFSFLAFLIPMIPMLLHDLTHGFPQTLKVGVWLVYRVAVLFGYPPVNPEFKGDSWNSIINFILDYNSRFFFVNSKLIALIIFSSVFLFLLCKAYKNNFKSVQENILIIFTFIPVISYLLSKTNSGAYLPMLFVQLAILVGFLFGNVRKKYFVFSTGVFLIIIGFNAYLSLKSYIGIPIKPRIEYSKEIIKMSGNEPYNIVILGPNSKFYSSQLNFEYLTWWLGKEPATQPVRKKIYVDELADRIIISGDNK